ncbi:MTA/SAH nucleosidase [Fictibacillus macauensis ZFHKF-1]|uniref:MTA/SAH nucleosidase n=1 Tax=Fictibacillus macauensis ZFHKF-1 TaxID=1196324 RepID=I8UHP7_9BACL|nr:5'-methylthioadenosine/S-adenosylhomocysteine nucleosidase [Fictibacillus macauensis]EIT86435.1 MTA/SAH nucleosidase [Fictibacillus macauensis ZFHKF-1]
MLCLFVDSEENARYAAQKGKIIDVASFDRITVYVSLFYGKPIIITSPGYTKVQMSDVFGRINQKYGITSFISTGNVGSLQPQLAAIGDIAIVTNALQYDVNFTPLGEPLTVPPFLGQGTFYANATLIEIAKVASEKVGFRYVTGRCISGDRFIANGTTAQQLQRTFNGTFIDSECGTYGELSFLGEIPFVAVKDVSNYANGNAVADYNRYVTQADLTSTEIGLEMISLIVRKR